MKRSYLLGNRVKKAMFERFGFWMASQGSQIMKAISPINH